MASTTYEHVTKIFDDTTAVNDLSIDVRDGEFLVLVGPSGCGKTTALRMLAGLEEISEGRILIGERVVNNLAPGARDVAMVFQSYALYPHMTVYDNLAFSLRNRRLPKPEIDRRVNEAGEVLELAPLLKRKPKQLSGGQRQRVALGRAIVREPAAFLMDEPLSNLDAALRVQTRAEILKLQKRLGTTTIYVTHDQVEAMTMGDRIAVMNKGVLQQIGTPQKLYTNPVNLFVAAFIGSPSMNLVPSKAVGVGREGQIAGFRPEHLQLGNGKANAMHLAAPRRGRGVPGRRAARAPPARRRADPGEAARRAAARGGPAGAVLRAALEGAALRRRDRAVARHGGLSAPATL
jgi:multiple sugar transport system ATP-binding protein